MLEVGMVLCGSSQSQINHDLKVFECRDIIVSSFHRLALTYFGKKDFGKGCDFKKIRSLIVLNADAYILDDVNKDYIYNAKNNNNDNNNNLYIANHLFQMFRKLVFEIEQRSKFKFKMQKIFCAKHINQQMCHTVSNLKWMDHIIISVTFFFLFILSFFF